MARTYRDAYGVPHVRAASVLDLAREQGRVTARDRTWQLEWQRRRATGTTAELVGEPGLPWDRFARRTMLLDTARRAYDALSEPTQEFVTAYVDGLAAGLADRAAQEVPELVGLDARAQAWEPWMPLAVFRAQHVLFASLGARLWHRRLTEVLGDDASLLSYDGPPTSGSNAWAVGPARTATGYPLIGGDPHRTIEVPGVYQQVRLACEDPDDAFDVVGFAFPGVPGVQHFAHAGEVAWAITNAMANTQDVCDEQVPPQDVVEQRTETIAVRGGPEVEVDVVRTVRGLVFEAGLSLRDSATVLGDVGFDALLPLLRARTVDDVDRALDHWVEPVNNVVVADVHGAVRYRIAGRVPVRDESGEWVGWLDPVPRTEVAADGEVVTANERRGPESDQIGTDFAPPYRADRIRALLAGRDDLTVEDFAAIHNDTELSTVPMLTSLVPGAFVDFDGRMDSGSVAAGRFAAWRSALVTRVVAHPVFDGLREPLRVYDPLFDPWLSTTSRIALALPQLVAAGSPFGIDLAALARDALAEVDLAEVGRTWGETHLFAPLHALDGLGSGEAVAAWMPPPVPLSGDTDCVRCTGSYPGLTDDCFRGSVARYVWDLSDRQRSGWVVPTGAAGPPVDPHHHDQSPLWAEGLLAPVVTDWEALTPEP